ncbi:TPA: hypothetical protein ACQWGQ_001967 [Neisseria subflava]|uniref:hypothetical protein n=1 Tax=Neisseria TaxID=482 RepID=UPI000AD94ABB|nr:MULTISPECIES: hypothetical protein [Neisseria]MCL9788055.1 hypothetical protein [Neisseria subflava]QCL71736.1 hypothetical protein FAH66_09815 [Neisseria subflava]WMS18662.1 hypothetical protein RDV50_04910 [Neisseria subflava]
MPNRTNKGRLKPPPFPVREGYLKHNPAAYHPPYNRSADTPVRRTQDGLPENPTAKFQVAPARVARARVGRVRLQAVTQQSAP